MGLPAETPKPPKELRLRRSDRRPSSGGSEGPGAARIPLGLNQGPQPGTISPQLSGVGHGRLGRGRVG